MKTTVLLLPVAAFFSTVLAGWGKEAPSKPSTTGVEPASNRRYDYKQSFKKPYLYNGAIPFWEHHGNSFVAQDFVRLTPSVPGLRGSVWRSSANEYKEWEVEFSFKTFGQNSNNGGRGLAFWYTQEKAVEGPIFGNKDQWKGLGVFMDTSDPANHRTSSVIYGIMNDGSMKFPANPTSSAGSFGGCMRDFKSTPFPVVVRVSYIGKTLKVSADTHSRGKKMVACFEHKDIELPIGHYFGVSALAAETGTPDDHDVHSFEVYEVNPPPRAQKPLRPHEEEMVKKGGEVKVDEKDKEAFEEVQKIVEEREQKIKEEKEGPDATMSSTQLSAMVAESQYRIIESLNTIHNKLEVLGAPVTPPESSSKSLEEINKKINRMAESLHAMENVVQGLVDHISKQGGGGDMVDITKVLKEELRSLNLKMEDIDTRQSFQHRLTQNRLVKSTSWMSYVVFLILLQVVAVSAYTWYKKRVEMSEKKFL